MRTATGGRQVLVALRHRDRGRHDRLRMSRHSARLRRCSMSRHRPVNTPTGIRWSAGGAVARCRPRNSRGVQPIGASVNRGAGPAITRKSGSTTASMARRSAHARSRAITGSWLRMRRVCAGILRSIRVSTAARAIPWSLNLITSETSGSRSLECFGAVLRGRRSRSRSRSAKCVARTATADVRLASEDSTSGSAVSAKDR